MVEGEKERPSSTRGIEIKVPRVPQIRRHNTSKFAW